MLTHTAPWLPKKSVAIAGMLTLALTVVIGMNTLQPRQMDMLMNTPIPFLASEGVPLTAGLVQKYDIRNGIQIDEVTFPDGDTSPVIFKNDRVYLVRIPASNSNVRSVPMDDVFRTIGGNMPGVNYFGYRYVTSNAVFEITARNALTFAGKFPGSFFASQAARNDDAQYGNMIAKFEASHGIKFLKTDGTAPAVSIAQDSLYVFVVNEPGGARFSPMKSPLCGNGVLDSGEECDDGNTVDDDVCSNQCYYNVPIPFGSGTSTLSIQVQTTAVSASAPYGMTGITLLRFQADARDDVRLDQLILNAQAGNILAAKNYALWRDTNANGVVDQLVQGGLTATSGLLTFSPVAKNLINSGASIIFEVRGDVANPPISASLQARLATLKPDYVAATRASGSVLRGIETNGTCNEVLCEINVRTNPSTVWTFTAPPASSSSSASSLSSSGSGSSSSSSSSSSAPYLLAVSGGEGLRSYETAPYGSTGVVLYRFGATVLTGGSIIFDKITFQADIGNLADVNNYTLWMNTDWDGIPDTLMNVIPTNTGGKLLVDLTTNNLVVMGTKLVFEVRGDPLPSSAGRQFQLDITGSGTAFIVAQKQSNGLNLQGIAMSSVCSVPLCEMNYYQGSTTWDFLPPSSSSSSSPSGYSPGTRFVLQVQPITTVSSAAYRTQNISLMRYRVTAVDDDALQVDLILQAVTGSLNSIQNYEIWRDTNDDGIVDSPGFFRVNPVGNRVSFTFMDELVSSGSTVIFEIWGDVALNPPTNNLQIQLAIADTDYIAAHSPSELRALKNIRTDGVCPTLPALCEMSVRTNPSRSWIFTQPVGPYCGDGILQPFGADGIDQVPNGTSDDETCDDGNSINNDSCDNTCRLVPIPPNP